MNEFMENFIPLDKIYIYIFEIRGFIVNDHKNHFIYKNVSANNLVTYEFQRIGVIDGLMDIRSLGSNSQMIYDSTIINNDKIGILTWKPINTNILNHILNSSQYSIKYKCYIYEVKNIKLKFILNKDDDDNPIITEFPLTLFHKNLYCDYNNKGYIDYNSSWYLSSQYISNYALNDLKIPIGKQYYMYFEDTPIWSFGYL